MCITISITIKNINKLPIKNEKIKNLLINIARKRKKVSKGWYIFIYMSIFITTSYTLYFQNEMLGNMGYYIDDYLKTYNLYKK
jgi:hypothetical protein